METAGIEQCSLGERPARGTFPSPLGAAHHAPADSESGFQVGVCSSWAWQPFILLLFTMERLGFQHLAFPEGIPEPV